MNITLQTICFTTANTKTSIHLSRGVDFNLTSVQYIRDGYFVNGKQDMGSSPSEAFRVGLAEIKGKIAEEITSVSVEVTSEMLRPDEVQELIEVSGLSGFTIQTY